MLLGKQLCGTLSLLLCVSAPRGIVVVLLGLVKVAEMVEWERGRCQELGVYYQESCNMRSRIGDN